MSRASCKTWNLTSAPCKRDLLAGDWQPGSYRTFWIRDPKERQISAAPFRDRVVTTL